MGIDSPAVALATVPLAPGTTSVPSGLRSTKLTVIIPFPFWCMCPFIAPYAPNTGPGPSVSSHGSIIACSTTSPLQSTTARSTMFCTSRTFPGQPYCCMSEIAPGSNRLGALPSRRDVIATKCSTSAGTSSARSRSAGTWIGSTLSRKNRSCRNSPIDTARGRSRLLVATTRTSTPMVMLEPTRSNARSCSTRSSLACTHAEISLISSSNSVPRSASSNRPLRSFSAPVNAPRSCPNSSLSSKLSLMAAQFIPRNASPPRADRSWIARATTSLPVPLSPQISTVPWLSATATICCLTRRIAAESPTIRSSPIGPTGIVPFMPGRDAGARVPSTAVRSTAFSRDRRACSIARFTATIISSPSNGLVM